MRSNLGAGTGRHTRRAPYAFADSGADVHLRAHVRPCDARVRVACDRWYSHGAPARRSGCRRSRCWLVAAGCWPLGAGCWRLAAGRSLLAGACWLWVAYRWLLPAGCRLPEFPPAYPFLPHAFTPAERRPQALNPNPTLTPLCLAEPAYLPTLPYLRAYLDAYPTQHPNP